MASSLRAVDPPTVEVQLRAQVMRNSPSKAQRIPANAKVKRDQQIVADRARGLTWRTIAGRHSLSVRQCQNIYRTQPLDVVDIEDPFRIVAEAQEQLEAIIEEAAVLAEETPNDSVRLGAINTRLKALLDKFALQRACGLLPSDLGLINQVGDVRRTAAMLVAFLKRLGVSEEQLRELEMIVRQGRIKQERGVSAGCFPAGALGIDWAALDSSRVAGRRTALLV